MKSAEEIAKEEEYTVKLNRNEWHLIYTLVLDRQREAEAGRAANDDSSTKFRLHLLDKLGAAKGARQIAAET